jgi:hypothetical protein
VCIYVSDPCLLLLSLSDSIRRYGDEKAIVPAINNSHPEHRLYRDSRYNRKGEERSYDIMSHTYRDAGQESNFQDTEIASQLASTTKAKDRALRYESHYDVINQEAKVVDAKGNELNPDKVFS